MNRYTVTVAPAAVPTIDAEIRQFLQEARIASRDASVPSSNSPNGSHISVYERGGWQFRDEWHGSVPFAGFTKISYLGTVKWTMHYWGSFTPAIDSERVCALLANILSKPLDLAPWRGPAIASPEGYSDIYYNEWGGNISSFHGHETVRNENGLLLYQADYRGGLVKY